MIAHFVLHALLGAAFIAWGMRLSREAKAPAGGSSPPSFPPIVPVA